MKSSFRRKVVKLYYSVKGFFKAWKFVEGGKYMGGSSNSPSIYRGGRLFYETIQKVEPTYGVVFTSTRNKKYPYWQIGILKWTRNEQIKTVTTEN